MRIEVTKANPYRDKKGRFAKANSRIAEFAEYPGGKFSFASGDTPAKSAAKFAAIQNVDRRHPLVSQGKNILSFMAHAHDISFNDARDIAVKAGVRSNLYRARKMLHLEPTDPIMTSKPSSKEFQSELKKRFDRKDPLIANFLSSTGRVSLKDQMRFEHSLVFNQVPLKEVMAMKSKLDFSSKVAAQSAIFTKTPALSVEFGKVFNDQKRAMGKTKPPGKVDLDHVVPKSFYAMFSSASIKHVNRTENLSWMSTEANRSKGNGMISKDGKKRNYDKLHPMDLKTMTVEALTAHRNYEKKYKHQFIKGGISQAHINAALKEGRSRAKHIAEMKGRKPKAIKWEHS
jgi:hypothetical protein